MKVEIILERNASSSRKSSALVKILKELGAKVTISGDILTVDDGHDEREVIDILNREGVDYSRSS